jgi:DNA-binding transcriptional regulator LsrR (DeoR family)
MSEGKLTDADICIRAAWLYYVHGLGQEEVGRQLHLSRSKVTRLLSQARDAGYVKVSVEHETVESLALADWIAANYNVRQCLLTPFARPPTTDPAASEAASRQSVGIVAANHIARRLQASGPITMGLGWGRTLDAFISALPAMSKPDLAVVSVIGASRVDDGTTSYSLALRLARATGGTAQTFASPLLMESAETAEAVRRDATIRATLDLAARADVIMLGCGDVSADNPYFRSAGIDVATIETLRRLGAVCEFAGRFLDGNGCLVPSTLDARTMGIGLDQLASLEVIVVASGRQKASPLKALLKSGLVHTIVIDDDIAQSLAERR